MFSLQTRLATIDRLQSAIDQGLGPDEKICIAMSTGEALQMIDVLDYPFPSEDVLVQPAEAATDREIALRERAYRKAGNTKPVKIDPSDYLYLVERNEFLRDTLANVGEQVLGLSRRVDALYDVHAATAVEGERLEKAHETDVFGHEPGEGLTVDDAMTGADLMGGDQRSMVSWLRKIALQALFADAAGVEEDAIIMGEGVETVHTETIENTVKGLRQVRGLGHGLKAVTVELAGENQLLLDVETV